MPLPHRELASELIGIPAAEVPQVWPAILPWIEGALVRVRGRYNAEDVYRWLESRDWQLWLSVRDGVIEACCCTEIIDYPRKRYCRLTLAGGHGRANWQHFMGEIEEWARIQRCDGMEMGGRPGWKRIFPDWENLNIWLEKEL